MKVFDFDMHSAGSTYSEQGWLHVRGGVSAEFLDHAREVVRRSGLMDAVEGPAIQGAKTQYVFDFPQGVDWGVDLLDAVAALSGLRRETLTLSERHIKAYLPDADPLPGAHKDRFASGIAIGLTLEVGPDSHVVIYPDGDRGVNPHLTATLRDGLVPERQPEAALRGAQEVEVHDVPGDVLAFPGADTWHLRRNAAGTVLLYLKFNDLGSDPLGEDLSTETRRRRTLELIEDDDAAALASAVPVLARRFDSVAEETGWTPGRTTWSVNVWEGDDRRSKTVPGSYAALVHEVDGTSTVTALAERGAAGLRGDSLVTAVRVLAAKGALDLLPAGASS